MGCQRPNLDPHFPEEHEEDDIEPKVIVTSTLIRCSYLMLVTLNDE